MPAIELRPRTGTEIVDAAFQLYRKHFVELITISAVVLAPLSALNLVLTGGDPTIQASRPFASLTLLFFAWIFSTLSEAAIVLAVSDSVLQGVVDATAALRRTLRRIMTVLVAAWLKWFVVLFGIGAALMVAGLAAALMSGAVLGGAGAAVAVESTGQVGIAVALALAAFAVGGAVGMYYYACYFAVSPAVMIEGYGAAASLTRSRQLSKGVRRKVLSTLGTPMFILMVLQVVIASIAQALPGPAAIGFVIQQATTVLLSPIVAVIATLLYYDARIRNEGFDIEIMTKELGEPSAAAAPSP
jgi:hypothetical protein